MRRKQNNLLPRWQATIKRSILCLFETAMIPWLRAWRPRPYRVPESSLSFLARSASAVLGEARRAATLAPCFQSRGTIDNTQSVQGAHLADSVVGGGWGWKETGCIRPCYRVTVLRGDNAVSMSMTSWAAGGRGDTEDKHSSLVLVTGRA